METGSLTVFAGSRAIATGTREAVAALLRERGAGGESPVLVFDDASGEQVDLDLRDSAPPEQTQARRPGRPRLGVVAREVTLLPRHWEWLNAQPGGASVALRKLVDQARRDLAANDRTRGSQEAAFRFMSAMAGNEPGFEEATRALYRCDRETFETLIAAWPDDVADYTRRLAAVALHSPDERSADTGPTATGVYEEQ